MLFALSFGIVEQFLQISITDDIITLLNPYLSIYHAFPSNFHRWTSAGQR